MDSHLPQDENVPLIKGDLNLNTVISDLDKLLDTKNTSNAHVHVKEYISQLKSRYNESSNCYKDDEELKSLILKHPYFKNPCKFPIRLISIMKYLQKKGVDIKEKDIDLRIDDLIASINEVERLEFGRYRAKCS